jgi:3-dehydroquinate synthase II
MKFFWVDCTSGKSPDDRKLLVTTALESGARGVYIKEEDVEIVSKLGDIDTIVDWSDTVNTVDTVDTGKGRAKGRVDIVMVGKRGEGQAAEIPYYLEESPFAHVGIDKSPEIEKIKELKEGLKGKGVKTCGYVEIRSKNHERLASLEAKMADYIVVVGKDWTVIPMENLVAELQKEDVKVIAGVNGADEAKLAFETLEVGVDGVLLQTDDIDEIKKVSDLTGKISEKAELKVAKITKLKQVGMGDRVCVDTASLLNIGEGMLVGSQSNGLFLVHSETLETEYVASRPFRVNAGAVHAYVMAPDGKTRYLSEVKAGDEVLAVDAKGNSRPVIIGRVKIEKRPLILVEAECESDTYKTLLQNAETITLVGADGKPVSIARLKVGDEIMVHAPQKARHFGMEIEESIIER